MQAITNLITKMNYTVLISDVRYGGGVAAFMLPRTDIIETLCDMLVGSDVEGTDSVMLGVSWFPLVWKDNAEEALAALDEKIKSWTEDDHTACSLYCQIIQELSSKQNPYLLRDVKKLFAEKLTDFNLNSGHYLLSLPGE